MEYIGTQRDIKRDPIKSIKRRINEEGSERKKEREKRRHWQIKKHHTQKIDQYDRAHDCES